MHSTAKYKKLHFESDVTGDEEAYGLCVGRSRLDREAENQPGALVSAGILFNAFAKNEVLACTLPHAVPNDE